MATHVEIRTFSNLSLALAPSLEFIECIDQGENLYRTDGGEHVGIMARSRTEATIFMLARKHKVDGLVSREGIGAAQ
jgi:hypothetical protein